MAAFALGAGLAAGSAFADPAYKSADFNGGLNTVTTNFASRLTAAGYTASDFQCFTCDGATPVGGNLVFDSSVPVGSGLVNVFSIAPITGVAANEVFTLSVGPIVMHLGDTGVQGGPAIQYNNGAFNGIFFAEDFTSPNHLYTLRFNAQGPTFSLKRLSDGATLLTGFINTSAGLMNVQDFAPAAAVPEPQSYALFIAGLLLLAFIALVRNSPIARPLAAR